MSPMNNRLLVPRKVPGLLDLVPGAAAAYSLRSLSNSYADPVVTVRRSSDDDEASFTASEVADGTLAAFCGAGDGLGRNGGIRAAMQAMRARRPLAISRRSSAAALSSQRKASQRFSLMVATTSLWLPTPQI